MERIGRAQRGEKLALIQGVSWPIPCMTDQGIIPTEQGTDRTHQGMQLPEQESGENPNAPPRSLNQCSRQIQLPARGGARHFARGSGIK